MAEYIEREALDKALTVAAANDKDKNRRTWAKAICVLHDLPAADVVPVVHGRWLCVDTDTEQFFLCNRCKKKEFWESNYCPNCGARMDGDDDAKEN